MRCLVGRTLGGVTQRPMQVGDMVWMVSKFGGTTEG